MLLSHCSYNHEKHDRALNTQNVPSQKTSLSKIPSKPNLPSSKTEKDSLLKQQMKAQEEKQDLEKIAAHPSL